jgi:hypothetical protein
MAGRWNCSSVHSQDSANGVNFQPTIRFDHMPHVYYDRYQQSTCPVCVMCGISCSQYTQDKPMDALIKQAVGVLQ